MIGIVFYSNNDLYVGFKAEGHADYAEFGNDIICAAVSVTLTALSNSIEGLLKHSVDVKGGENGYLEMHILDLPDNNTQLLFEHTILTIDGIAKEYNSRKKQKNNNKKYIDLKFEEV